LYYLLLNRLKKTQVQKDKLSAMIKVFNNTALIRLRSHHFWLFFVGAIIFITAAYLGWEKLHFGFNFRDEGYHMTESWRLAAGDHFLRDKFTGALLHYTLINSMIFRIVPDMTLLDFRSLQFFLTLGSLVFLSLALTRLQDESWQLPIIFSIFAFTGIDASGMISNLYYHTYPHLFLTVFLALFIFAITSRSLPARSFLFLTSGLCLWAMSLSTLYTGTVILAPVVLYFMMGRSVSNTFSFSGKELSLTLTPFFVCWGIFLAINGPEYLLNLIDSARYILSMPTHSSDALIRMNMNMLFLIIVSSIVLSAIIFLIRNRSLPVAIGGLAILSPVIYFIIDTSLWGLLPTGMMGSALYCSAFLIAFLILFWVSVFWRMFRKSEPSWPYETGIILLVPATILSMTTSIFSTLGAMSILHASIPILAAIGAFIIGNNKTRLYSTAIRSIFLVLILSPFYINLGLFDWRFTFYDVTPSQAYETIDHGFGKGIHTNKMFKDLYVWIKDTSQRYSGENDYIISYVLTPMAHMIAQRRPSLDDTFIDFMKNKEYYKRSIEFMKQRHRQPRLAYVFDRPVGFLPISLDEGKFVPFRPELSPGSQDPISLYIRNNMYLLDQFQAEQGFVVQCFVDNPIDPAIARLTKVLQRNPSDAELFLQLGNLYARKKDHALAIESIEKSLSLNPHSVAALNQLARSCAQVKRFDDAVEALQKVLDIQGDNADVYYNLACMYSKMRKIDDSLLALVRTVDLGFKDCSLLMEDPDLDAVRDTARFREIVQTFCSEQK